MGTLEEGAAELSEASWSRRKEQKGEKPWVRMSWWDTQNTRNEARGVGAWLWTEWKGRILEGQPKT